MMVDIKLLSYFGSNKEKDSDFVGGWVQISIPPGAYLLAILNAL